MEEMSGFGGNNVHRSMLDVQELDNTRFVKITQQVDQEEHFFSAKKVHDYLEPDRSGTNLSTD